MIDLKANGYIVETSKVKGVGYPINYHKLDSNYNLQWSIEGKSISMAGYLNYLAGSEYTKYVYYYQFFNTSYKIFDSNFEFKRNNKIFLTKIDETGNKQSITIETPDDFKIEYIKAVFSTSDYLVFISNNFRLNKDKVKKKNISEKMLNEFIDLLLVPHNGTPFKHIRMLWDPNIDKSSLEFLGNTNDAFYLGLRTIDFNNKKVSNQIYKTNLEGKIQETKKFEAQLENVPVPLNNSRELNGQDILVRDIDSYYSNTSAYFDVRNSAFGGNKLDLVDGRFYYYGFMAEKVYDNRSARNGNLTTHLFLCTYDLNSGELLNKFERKIEAKEFSKTLFADGVYFSAIDLKVFNTYEVALIYVVKYNSNIHSLNLNTKEFEYKLQKINNLKQSPFNQYILQSVLGFSKNQLGKLAYDFVQIQSGNEKENNLDGFLKKNTTIIFKTKPKENVVEVFPFEK